MAEQSKNARKGNAGQKELCKLCKNPVEVTMMMPGKKMHRKCCEKAAKNK